VNLSIGGLLGVNLRPPFACRCLFVDLVEKSQVVVIKVVRSRRRPLTRRPVTATLDRFAIFATRGAARSCRIYPPLSPICGVRDDGIVIGVAGGVSVRRRVGAIFKELAASLEIHADICIPCAATDFKPRNWPFSRFLMPNAPQPQPKEVSAVSYEL